jgi:Dolichyl-phosphate-mannose-protein mannosyltransferase
LTHGNWGIDSAGRSEIAFLTARRVLLLACCLLAAGLLVRLDGIDRPPLSTRELHNTLLARQYQLGQGAGLPRWRQEVLTELRRSVRPVEPPVLDRLAGWEFQLLGGEHIWLPRAVSAFLWVLGGVFLFLLSLRVTNRVGALVALALYLFWPYGVVMSRLYIPDPLMVALLLAGALAVVRYWEAPSRRRLAEASVVAAVATATKPGIDLVFLVVLFAALAVAHGALRRSLLGGTLPAFAAAAAAPTAAYWFYGTFIEDFLLSLGDAGNRLQVHLITSGSFWRGWWEQLSVVLPFPQHQRYLALIPLVAGLAGLMVARAGPPRAIIAGLGLGYVAYAVAVAGFTATNAYYALPVIPILALAIGALAGFVVTRTRAAEPRAGVAVLGLIALVVAIGAYKSRPDAVDRTAIADYQRIGELTGHTTNAVVIDERLRSPAMYWGWIVAHYWYEPTPGQDLPASGNPFPTRIDPARATYLVVVGAAELQSERRLRTITRTLPVVARTARYAVFDVRGGRLARSVSAGARSGRARLALLQERSERQRDRDHRHEHERYKHRNAYGVHRPALAPPGIDT